MARRKLVQQDICSRRKQRKIIEQVSDAKKRAIQDKAEAGCTPQYNKVVVGLKVDGRAYDASEVIVQLD